jgi:23S rRNA (adenine2503-C2)-methyltransferase
VTDSQKTNLFEFDLNGLADYFKSQGEQAFRAQQVIQWTHQRGVLDFQLMTNLSQKLRDFLTLHATVMLPTICREQNAADGTKKWLCSMADGQQVEMVYIPEPGRGTLCISSQVGCPLNCTFCATGSMGFTRNLTTSEIIGQVWLANQLLANNNFPKERPITNVVLMGMGEPLLNLQNVVTAINIMLEDLAYGLSKYRVTVSTSGIVPVMEELKALSPVAIAVSLHAPNDELRNKLVPINKKYPLAQLIPACGSYFSNHHRMVTFEYVMLHGVNDSLAHAKELAKLLRNVRCKINLIPYNSPSFTTKNPSKESFTSSTPEQIDKFREFLLQSGFNTIVRRTRGGDIAAACGQLATQSS